MQGRSVVLFQAKIPLEERCFIKEMAIASMACGLESSHRAQQFPAVWDRK